METKPLREYRVGGRRRATERRRVERRMLGERRNSQALMPTDSNRRQGLDRRIIYRRLIIFRRGIEDRRVAALR